MKKFPFSVLLSGIINWMITTCVMGIVGVAFLIFGFLASYNLFKILGFAIVIFYFAVCIVNPVRSLSHLSKELSDIELDAIIEDTLKNKKMRYYFESVMKSADERLCSRYAGEEDAEGEEESDDEEYFEDE